MCKWFKMKFQHKNNKSFMATLIVSVSVFIVLQLLISSIDYQHSNNVPCDIYDETRTIVETGELDLSNSTEEERDMNKLGSLKDVLIDELIQRLKFESPDFFPVDFFKCSMNELTRHLGEKAVKNSTRLSEFAHINMSAPLPAWNLMYANIRQHALYDPDDENIDNLMHNMATLPVQSINIIKGGTQLNLLAILQDGTKTVMKPMRYPRERDELNDTFYFDFMERHTAEIAGFQLDKVLGFYRVPPTVGRKLNIVTEFMSVASKDIQATLFKSQANNTCFYGNCARWCDVAHAYCGYRDVIEVSMMMYLPQQLKHVRLPWFRTYSHRRKATWETINICNTIRKTRYFKDTRVLREAIDAYLFDYMTGNEDRHTFYYHEEFKYLTYSVLRDNGKGFGRHSVDAESNLEPLLQCCLLKKSTILKFIKLYLGPEHLSFLVERALSSDPVSPVLTSGHLQALDRRVIKVLHAMTTCINKHGVHRVIEDDIL